MAADLLGLARVGGFVAAVSAFAVMTEESLSTFSLLIVGADVKDSLTLAASSTS